MDARENGDRAGRPVLGCRCPQRSRDHCALCVVCLLALTYMDFVALLGGTFLLGDRVSRGIVLQAGVVREHG